MEEVDWSTETGAEPSEGSRSRARLKSTRGSGLGANMPPETTPVTVRFQTIKAESSVAMVPGGMEMR